MNIVEHNNQLLVKAVLGVFGDDGASDAVLERMLVALEGAVCEANDEHSRALANKLYWEGMTRDEELVQGWPEDCGEQFAKNWERTAAKRLRSLGRIVSLQHEIQKFL